MDKPEPTLSEHLLEMAEADDMLGIPVWNERGKARLHEAARLAAAHEAAGPEVAGLLARADALEAPPFDTISCEQWAHDLRGYAATLVKLAEAEKRVAELEAQVPEGCYVTGLMKDSMVWRIERKNRAPFFTLYRADANGHWYEQSVHTSVADAVARARELTAALAGTGEAREGEVTG